MPRPKRRGATLMVRKKKGRQKSSSSATPSGQSSEPSLPPPGTPPAVGAVVESRSAERIIGQGNKEEGEGPRTEKEVESLLQKKEPLFDPTKEREMKRLGVAMMFVYRYGAPEHPADRPFGMMKELKASFGFSKNTKIDYILDDVLFCKKRGLQYCPKMKYAETSNK